MTACQWFAGKRQGGLGAHLVERLQSRAEARGENQRIPNHRRRHAKATDYTGEPSERDRSTRERPRVRPTVAPAVLCWALPGSEARASGRARARPVRTKGRKS